METLSTEKNDTIDIHYWETKEDYDCAVRKEESFYGGMTANDAIERLKLQYETDALFAGEVILYKDGDENKEVLLYRFETDDIGNVSEDFPSIEYFNDIISTKAENQRDEQSEKKLHTTQKHKITNKR